MQGGLLCMCLWVVPSYVSLRLGFANLILLLDVPQLPAIAAANVSKGFKKCISELKNLTSQEIIYPNNRRRALCIWFFGSKCLFRCICRCSFIYLVSACGNTRAGPWPSPPIVEGCLPTTRVMVHTLYIIYICICTECISLYNEYEYIHNICVYVYDV